MALTGHLALLGTFTLASAWGLDNRFWYINASLGFFFRDSITVLYWASYVGSYLALMFSSRWAREYGHSRAPNGKVVGVWTALWKFRIVINAFVMLLTAIVMVALVVMTQVGSDNLVAAGLVYDDQRLLRTVFLVALMCAITPIFLGMMHSVRAFETMVSSFLGEFDI